MIALILALIFLLLSLLHLTWAMGSKWGWENSIPSDEKGNKVLSPSKKDCIVVGIGLMIFSGLYVSNYLNTTLLINETVERIALLVVPCIFLLRSIGDFKYVGLFKKVKQTRFGKTDTSLIIPLCVTISALGFWIALS